MLSQCEEPLVDELSIPIFTLYWGYAFPVEEVTKPLLEEYRTEKQKNEFAIPRVSGSPLSDAMLVYPFETCSPDAEMCGIGMIRHLMEQPIPTQLLENREAEVRKAESETAERIAAARAELNLPASDVLIEDLQSGGSSDRRADRSAYGGTDRGNARGVCRGYERSSDGKHDGGHRADHRGSYGERNRTFDGGSYGSWNAAGF